MSTDSSKTAVMQQFEGLSDIGQSVMDDITNVQIETLLAFEQFLSQANLMKTRIDRVCGEGIICRWVMCDFLDVDLPNTTATLRPDASAATLRERGGFVEAVVKGITFSCDKGTYQSLNNTYKVMSQGSIPTGTFQIEYISPVMGNQVVFDLVVPNADCAIAVSGIGPDLTEFAANSLSRNGYRVSAWLPNQAVKYLKIVIVPTGPDVAGGMGYTFGITDLNSSSLTYQLSSDLVMKPITLSPLKPKVRFQADSDPNLNYFVSFDGENYSQVLPGADISLPGYDHGEFSGTLGGGGGLGGMSLPRTLPMDVIYASVVAWDENGNFYPALSGLAPGQTPANPYLIIGSTLMLVPAGDSSRNFRVGYTTGPPTIQVWLKVRFSTSSNIVTPIFTGAHLEEYNA